MPEMKETQVWSLGREDPLEEGMATHSSSLAWRIPWTEEPGGLQSMGLQRVGHEWVTNSFFSRTLTWFLFIPLYFTILVLSSTVLFIYSLTQIFIQQTAPQWAIQILKMIQHAFWTTCWIWPNSFYVGVYINSNLPRTISTLSQHPGSTNQTHR